MRWLLAAALGLGACTFVVDPVPAETGAGPPSSAPDFGDPNAPSAPDLSDVPDLADPIVSTPSDCRKYGCPSDQICVRTNPGMYECIDTPGGGS